jgi:hypothetical protein
MTKVLVSAISLSCLIGRPWASDTLIFHAIPIPGMADRHPGACLRATGVSFLSSYRVASFELWLARYQGDGRAPDGPGRPARATGRPRLRTRTGACPCDPSHIAARKLTCPPRIL